ERPSQTSVRRRADAAVGRYEPGFFAGNDKVAGEREAETSTRSSALDAGNDRCRQFANGTDRAVKIRDQAIEQRQPLILWRRSQEAQVASGHEALAFAT